MSANRQSHPETVVTAAERGDSHRPANIGHVGRLVSAAVANDMRPKQQSLTRERHMVRHPRKALLRGERPDGLWRLHVLGRRARTWTEMHG